MSYTLPPSDILRIFDAPQPPIPVRSPDRGALALVTHEPHPPVATLARAFLRLGGVRVDPAIGCRQRTMRLTSLQIVRVEDGSSIDLNLPTGATIGLPVWSPDCATLAFTLDVDDGVELWVADAATAVARSLGVRVNDVLSAAGGPQLVGAGGGGFAWARGSGSLLVRLALRGEAGDEVPGPRVQDTAGKQSQMATFQDLLRDEKDERLFEQFATTQLARVDIRDGTVEPLGEPCMPLSARISPDGQHVCVTRLHRPFSYRVPFAYFSRTTEVWDSRGALEHVVAELPVSDEIPRQGVPTGPRGVTWHEGRPACLVWTEALDGGDPKTPADHRDRVMTHDAPFRDAPREAMRVRHRLLQLAWMDDPDTALLTEHDRDRRWRTTSIVDLDDPRRQRVLFDLSMHDAYNDPGTPVQRSRPDGARLVMQDRGAIFLAGRGATAGGDRPFLDRFDLETQTSERLWRCAEGGYEAFMGFCDESRDSILIRSETNDTPTNYVVVSLASGDRRAITSFPDPHPEITGARKQIVRYRRDDGVELSATLHLPPGYEAGARVPVIIWAYPYDYSDPATAGQVRGSDDTFTRIAGASPLWFLVRGYAVLMDAQMPIVGDPDTMNDTFVEQVCASAKAAIDALDAMGVADRGRIVVSGHSYGGFMTATLLAHTDWFAAGVARSGAYNRSLTPFGFQTERRSYWEVPEVYFRVSPFSYAHQIKTPILLVHGEADNNSGTFPVQSERLFQAIQGQGGTARLVMLPHESHGYRGRESVLHVIAEMLAWADRWTSSAVREEAQEAEVAVPGG